MERKEPRGLGGLGEGGRCWKGREMEERGEEGQHERRGVGKAEERREQGGKLVLLKDG